jgi:hypothetical protein
MWHTSSQRQPARGRRARRHWDALHRCGWAAQTTPGAQWLALRHGAIVLVIACRIHHVAYVENL